MAPDDHRTLHAKHCIDFWPVASCLTCWYMDAEGVTQQLLGSAGTLLGRSRLLPPQMLEAVRVKDATQPGGGAEHRVRFIDCS